MCVCVGRGGAGLGYLVGPHSCAAVEAGAGGMGGGDHHCIAGPHEWPIVHRLAVSASLLYSENGGRAAETSARR